MILPILCVLSLAVLLGILILADIHRHDPVRGQRIIADLAEVIANILFFPVFVGNRLFLWTLTIYAHVIWWEHEAAAHRLRQLYVWACRRFPEFKAYMRSKTR